MKSSPSSETSLSSKRSCFGPQTLKLLLRSRLDAHDTLRHAKLSLPEIQSELDLSLLSLLNLSILLKIDRRVIDVEYTLKAALEGSVLIVQNARVHYRRLKLAYDSNLRQRLRALVLDKTIADNNLLALNQTLKGNRRMPFACKTHTLVLINGNHDIYRLADNHLSLTLLLTRAAVRIRHLPENTTQPSHNCTCLSHMNNAKGPPHRTDCPAIYEVLYKPEAAKRSPTRRHTCKKLTGYAISARVKRQHAGNRD